MKLNHPFGDSGEPAPDQNPDAQVLRGESVETVGQPVPGAMPHPECEAAVAMVHELVDAAMHHRVTVGMGPNPFKPGERCVILQAIHPEDIHKIAKGDQDVRSLPIAIILNDDHRAALRKLK